MRVKNAGAADVPQTLKGTFLSNYLELSLKRRPRRNLKFVSRSLSGSQLVPPSVLFLSLHFNVVQLTPVPPALPAGAEEEPFLGCGGGDKHLLRRGGRAPGPLRPLRNTAARLSN